MNQKVIKKWVFFSALPPFRGGISKFSEATFTALEQQLLIKGFTFKQQYPNFLFPGSSQLDPTAKDTTRFKRIASTFSPWSYFRALYFFRREHPAVFVTSYWMTFFSPMMTLWAFFLPKQVKKIAIIHNLKPHESRFFDGFFNRIFLRNYDGFVVLSESVARDITALKPTAKIRLIPHPPYEIEPTKLNQVNCRQILGLDPNKKTLLFFGLIRPYKGLAELIEAFYLMINTNLLLPGKCTEIPKLIMMPSLLRPIRIGFLSINLFQMLM